MPENKDQPLEERLEQLEQLVEKLQYTIERMQDRIGSNTPSRPPVQRSNRPSLPIPISRKKTKKERPPSIDQELQTGNPAVQGGAKPRPMYGINELNSGAWLNRIVLGMLFLAVAISLNFFFTQDWFTDVPRVMAGGFVGLLLLALGLHFHHRRRLFGQVLLGGAIAAFYLTAFVAYQAYELVPSWVSFAVMLLITILSFLLAAKRDDAVLAILATLGGLATPFILQPGGDFLFVLVRYTSLILIGAGAMYWFRGWRSLLFISAFGSWLIIVFCYFSFGFQSFQSVAAERWALQFSVILSWVLFWIMPVVRGMKRAFNPAKWPAPPPVSAVGYFFNHPALPLSISSPLITLTMSILIWDLSDNLWGWIALLASSIYGFLYLYIRGKERKDLNHLAQMQGLTASIFLTVGLFLLYDGHAVLVALVAEAILIRLISRYMEDKAFSAASHALFLFLFVWIVNRMISVPAAGTPFLNASGLGELLVIAVSASMTFLQNKRWLKITYPLMAHLLFLAWSFRELIHVQSGQALITAVWGVYGIGLFILTLRQSDSWLRLTAFSTLAIVVLKLLLFDLANVDPLLRILLFLGFGIVFMMLSYIIPRWFEKRAGATKRSRPTKEAEREPSL